MSFAAFGLGSASGGESPALMAMAAMLYKGHVLGWMMSASYLNTFNGLTKTSVELGDGKAYPLVPFNLDEKLGMPVIR